MKVISAFCILISIISCSKSNPSPSILGKWHLSKRVLWEAYQIGVNKDTTQGHSGEYVDFKLDGKEYASYWNGIDYSLDTFNYSVNGNQIHTSKINGLMTDSELNQTASDSLSFYNKSGNTQVWFFYFK